MLEDVKIYTSPDKNSVEKFIMEMDEKWYFKAEFRTNIVYRSFQFSWDNQVVYTVVMTKYKDMAFENIPTEWLSTLYDNDNKDAISTMVESEVKNEWDNKVLWGWNKWNWKYSKTKEIAE